MPPKVYTDRQWHSHRLGVALGASKTQLGVSGAPAHSPESKARGPRGHNLLSDAACKAAKPGATLRKLVDGDGMYLAVTPSGGKLWRLKYRLGGSEGTYSIGSYPQFGVSAARTERDKAKAWIAEGLDPSKARAAEQAAAKLAQGQTFATVAADYLGRQDFTRDHRQALQTLLDRDLLPAIGAVPIAELTTPQVLAALRPIEARAPESCAKARRLIGQVCRYGIATGIAKDDPAAALARGVLKRAPGEHRATVPTEEMPALLAALAAVPAELSTRLAVYWVLLTACRTGEMRFAPWSEISGDTWIVPAPRMKMRRDHVVPLSRQALRVLDAARALRTTNAPDELIFPGFTRSGYLSENAITALLARCGFFGRQTGHGFRASFSTWAHETAKARVDVTELCLAHTVQGVRGRYNRALYLDERRALLQQWADQLEAWGMVLPE